MTPPKHAARPAASKSSAKSSSKSSSSATGRPAPAKSRRSRLAPLAEADFTAEQKALLAAIRSGPRGKDTPIEGPFAVYLRSPAYGDLAQALGGHCRLGTSVPKRLSELAILMTARHWRAQYEWHAHAPIAEEAGLPAATIRALRAGRRPAKLRADEAAVFDFVTELYRSRRVSDPTYRRIHKVLGEAGAIELTGILGYYALVAMTLNVFRMPLPARAALPFREP